MTDSLAEIKVAPLSEIQPKLPMSASAENFFSVSNPNTDLYWQRGELMNGFESLRTREMGKVNLTDPKFIDRQNAFLDNEKNKGFVDSVLSNIVDQPQDISHFSDLGPNNPYSTMKDKLNNWAFFTPQVGPQKGETGMASYQVIKGLYDFYQKNPDRLATDQLTLLVFCQTMFGENTGGLTVNMIQYMITTGQANFDNFQTKLNTLLQKEPVNQTPSYNFSETSSQNPKAPKESPDDKPNPTENNKLREVRDKIKKLSQPDSNQVAPETGSSSSPYFIAENQIPKNWIPGDKRSFANPYKIDGKYIPVQTYYDNKSGFRIRTLTSDSPQLVLLSENGSFIPVDSQDGVVLNGDELFILGNQIFSREETPQGWKFKPVSEIIKKETIAKINAFQNDPRSRISLGLKDFINTALLKGEFPPEKPVNVLYKKE